MAAAVGTAAVSGCSGLSAKAAVTSASTTFASQSETTAASASETSGETKQSAETSESKTVVKISKDTVSKKRTELMKGEYICGIGTSYLGESENQAAMEVVLAEMGVDEELLKDTSRFIDCGGSDLWLLCISDDVVSFKITVGEDEDGKELFKAEKGNIPDYIFIRCFASGEMSSCTVTAEGKESGHLVYYPIMIGEQIPIPNGGGVLNQSEGYETYIDVPGDAADESESESKKED